MIEAIIEAQHTLCARLETLRNLEESSPAELRLRMSMLRLARSSAPLMNWASSWNTKTCA